MILRTRQFLSLAGLTAIEALRQPICLLLTIVAILATALTPMLLLNQFGEEGRLVRDGALAFHFVVGLLLAGHAASCSLSREMKSGTASAVLSKPVSRELFFLAKFTGVSIAVSAFSLCTTAAALLAERVSEKYSMDGFVTDWQTGAMLLASPFAALGIAGLLDRFAGKPFKSTAYPILMTTLVAVIVVAGFFDRLGQPAPFALSLDLRLLPAFVLVSMALLVAVAISLTISTKLALIPTVVVSTALMFAGLMSDHLVGRFAQDSIVAAALYRAIPNWKHFWIPAALGAGGEIPWVYVGMAALYAATYALGVLCLGMALFRHCETT